MTRNTVHDLSDAELIEELAAAKDALFKSRFELATGALENTTRLGHWKRQIARINTELREREIAAAEAAASSTERTA